MNCKMKSNNVKFEEDCNEINRINGGLLKRIIMKLAELMKD